jgi:glycosyltransferase involved in cell wall biosynthesis
MNLLFLDSIEKETYGGMEEWIRLSAAGLASKGHSITVAGRTGSEYLRRVSGDGNGLKTLGLRISGDFNPITIARLKKYLQVNDIDIITVNFNKDLRLGGLAARWTGKTRVVWSVGMDITRDNKVHRYLTPRLIDGVIVPSESLKKQITAPGYIDENSVTVIPVGIAEKNFTRLAPGAASGLRRKYNLPDDSLIAITVGRFTEHKGHRYLIDIAHRIVKKYPSIIFLLVGDGPLRSALETRIETAGMEKYFILTGMLENLDLELAGADLMIHPSVKEPFGIAILEGMRAGLPVVAGRVGGIPEVVAEGETGLLAEPRNQDSLCNVVFEMLDSPEKRKSFGAAGQRRWRSNFRLETMLERIEDYFRNLRSSTK